MRIYERTIDTHLRRYTFETYVPYSTFRDDVSQRGVDPAFVYVYSLRGMLRVHTDATGILLKLRCFNLEKDVMQMLRTYVDQFD